MRSPTPSRAAISTTCTDELGDLLLQVVYHARMAEEQNAFAFGDVVEAITRKMIRRHPHVFADENGKLTPAGVKARGSASRPRRRPNARRGGLPKTARTNRCCRASRRASRRCRARWNCSARPPASASTGTIPARCCARSARKPTRSRPRWTAATPGRARRGNRRSAVRAGQSGAPCRRRSRSCAARHQRQVRTPLRLYRAQRWPREGSSLEQSDARGNGRAVERGEGSERSRSAS